MEEMIMLLNKETLTEEEGKILNLKLGITFNCSGSKSKKSAEIYNTLTPEGKYNFMKAVCMSAFELAHSYNPDAKYVDDRKKASQIFAAKNINWFNDVFKECTGFTPFIRKSEDGRFLQRDIEQKEFKKNGYDWLLGYLRAWTTEHSTIKQYFFGGVVNGILLVEYPEAKFMPNSDYSISFPFI